MEEVPTFDKEDCKKRSALNKVDFQHSVHQTVQFRNSFIRKQTFGFDVWVSQLGNVFANKNSKAADAVLNHSRQGALYPIKLQTKHGASVFQHLVLEFCQLLVMMHVAKVNTLNFEQIFSLMIR